MSYKHFLIGSAMACALAWSAARAQEPAKPAQAPAKPAQDAPASEKKTGGGARKPPDRAALERDFEKTLTNVTLKGSWRLTRRDEKTGQTVLGEPREETYAIESAHKAEDDWWVIKARVQFSMGEGQAADVTLPVRVRVVWSEDTPIITLDETVLPGLGAYGARVMIYRDSYAGVWFGRGYGGVMAGQIVKTDAAPPADGKKADEKGKANP